MPNLAAPMGASKLAAWVADLPAREETTEMFRRFMGTFIRRTARRRVPDRLLPTIRTKGATLTSADLAPDFVSRM